MRSAAAILLLLLTCTVHLPAKEALTPETLFRLLDSDNPHVVAIRQQALVAQHRELYARGAFDLKADAEVQRKEYAISTAEFSQAGISKKLYNGTTLKLDYRRSVGTQEYNNIKTSEEGEMLVGLKIPVVALLMQSNTDRLKLELAELDADQAGLDALQKRRRLLYETLRAYYSVLGAKIFREIDRKFAERTAAQKGYIGRKIREGQLATIALAEQQAFVLRARSRLAGSEEAYQNALESLLYYLGMSKEKFSAQYILPDIGEVRVAVPTLEASLETAVANRPDLKMLQLRKEQLLARKRNAGMMRYPSLDLGAYGNYDFKYKEGYKLTLGLSYPLGQRQAKGKNAEIEAQMIALESLWKQKLLSVKNDLAKIRNMLISATERRAYAKQRVALLQKLYHAQKRRFELGDSDLLRLNMRQIDLLEARKAYKRLQTEIYLLRESYRLKTFGGKI